jgi:hypothetical protein
MGCASCRRSLDKFRVSRGRWDRNRTGALRLWRPHPACRVVSDAIATCRSAPHSLSSSAAGCRRVSAVTGADTGQPRLLRALFSQLSVSNPRPYTPDGWPDGLIRRVFLAEPVRSGRPMSPRILRWKRLRPSRSVPLRSSCLLADEMHACQAIGSFNVMQTSSEESFTFTARALAGF